MRRFELVPFGCDAPDDAVACDGLVFKGDLGMTGIFRTERRVRMPPDEVARRALEGDPKAA